MFNKEDPTIVELTLPFRIRGKVLEFKEQGDMVRATNSGQMAVWNLTLYIPTVCGTYCVQKEGPMAGRYRCGWWLLSVEDVVTIMSHSDVFYHYPEKILTILSVNRVEVSSSIEMGALKQYGITPAIWNSSGTVTLDCDWVKEEWVTEEGKVSFPCTVVLKTTERHAALRAIRHTLETAE